MHANSGIFTELYDERRTNHVVLGVLLFMGVNVVALTRWYRRR